MKRVEKNLFFSDPAKMSQAGDINSECDISACTNTFLWLTSFSNPQDAGLPVSGRTGALFV